MSSSQEPIADPASAAPKSSPQRLDRLQRWLAIVANLGVLGGLVLVALQMSQSVRGSAKSPR
jgi:hypothetical protein